MINKKLVTVVVTVIFIGVAGILYSLEASKKTDPSIILTNNNSQNEMNSIGIGNSEKNNLEQNNLNQNNLDQNNLNQSNIDQNNLNQSNSGQNNLNQSDLEQGNLIQNSEEQDDLTLEEGSKPQEKQLLYVHICGEVVREDVYELTEGARVIDVIKLAGGLTKKAAGAYINQAELVTDGQRIYIPSIKEIEENKITLENKETIVTSDRTENESGNSTTSTFININTASMKELMTLTGIGEAKANSIIAYRESNGKFKTIEELKKIEGIKDGVFNKICHLITVN